MKNTLLLTALVSALALVGCNKSTRTATTADTNPSTTATTADTTTAGQRIDAAANRASDNIADAAHSASNAMHSAVNSTATQARIVEWKLSASDIQADLDRNNPIVRTRDTAAGAPTGKVDTSVVKSAVEGKFAADSDLAPLKLDVDADKTGEVKLSGKAHSADQVSRAIATALDTDGVNKVTSKIKLDKDAKTTR